MMRAAVMREYSADLSGELVLIEEVPTPRPVDAHDVVVRIAGAGVCRTELHILRGEIEVPLPHILGHENAGFVEAVGESVTAVGVGDPVLCYPFLADGLSPAERRGLDSNAPDRITPGIDAPGGFAEFLLCHERAVLPLPPGTDPAPLAPLTDAGLAAYRACTKPSLVPGSIAVVFGAGGLGHLAIQILKATTPARVVAVDPKLAARELGTACGADIVCAPDELEGALAEPASAVFDFVGSDETVATGLTALGFAGHFLAVGVGGDLSVPVFDLVTTEKKVEGVYVGTYQDLVEVTALALQGRLHTRVERFPLSQADRALHALADGDIAGRAVLVPD